MYTDEELEQVEQTEESLTEEALVLMFAALGLTQGELETEIRLFYQKYGKDGVVTYQEARKWVSDKNHRRRMNVLLALVSVKFALLTKTQQALFETTMRDIVATENAFYGTDIKYEDLDLRHGEDNLDWSQRLTNNINKWSYILGIDLTQAFIRREKVEDVIKQLNKRFTTMEKVLKQLLTTESTAVRTKADKEIFDVKEFTKYRFYANEDERTCELCGSLHGLVFPLSALKIGVNAPQLHTNCRCRIAPIKR